MALSLFAVDDYTSECLKAKKTVFTIDVSDYMETNQLVSYQDPGETTLFVTWFQMKPSNRSTLL
jgi:hypothetical protein